MAYSDRDRVYAWLDAGHGEKLTTVDRCILVTIAERANDKSGLAAPGVGELARRWGIHPESAGRSVARLHRLGLLETVSRGYGQHRARYVLAGELAKLGKVAQPTGLATSPTENPSSPTENPSSPTDGLGVLSESSRSSSEVRTTPLDTSSDDDAARASAMGSGAASSDKGSTRRLSLAAFGEVAEALGLEDEAARSWAEDILARATRTVGNPDAYIRRSIATELAQQKKAKAKKSTAKPKRRSTKRTATKKKSAAPAEPELLHVAQCNEAGCSFEAVGATSLVAYAKVDAHAAEHARVCQHCGQTYLRKNFREHGNGKCKPRDAVADHIYIQGPDFPDRAAPPAPVTPQPTLCQHCGQSYYPEWAGDHLNGACVQPRPPVPPVTPYPVAPIPHRADQW